MSDHFERRIIDAGNWFGWIKQRLDAEGATNETHVVPKTNLGKMFMTADAHHGLSINVFPENIRDWAANRLISRIEIRRMNKMFFGFRLSSDQLEIEIEELLDKAAQDWSIS